MKKSLFALLLVAVPLAAGSVTNLKWKRDYALADASAEDHFAAGMEAIGARDWQSASRELRIIRDHFPTSPLAKEAAYHLGTVEFERGEYDIASEYLTTYLNEESMPQHFEEIFQRKFVVAEAFKEGYHKRAGGWRGMPRWQGAEGDALEIYQEVATALPSHELGEKSLFASADILGRRKDYTEAIEKYQTLISRFPKGVLAPSSYLAIAQLHLDKVLHSPQDPDVLPLAQLNVKRFRQDFPMDERLTQAEACLDQMREHIAQGLFDTARYYEKKKEDRAAYVYYLATTREYPETGAADRARVRLEKLGDLIS
jgi:outer membrane protein assembly factor BamD (BamD/ComL family)